MLEPLREKLQVSFQADFYEVDHGWVNRFSARLREATVGLSVTLGETRISVEELLGFSPGDVVMLDQPVKKPLIGSVEGMPKFLGFPGMSKGSQSFQIAKVIMPKD